MNQNLNHDPQSLIGLTLNIDTEDGTSEMEVAAVFTANGQDYAALSPVDEDAQYIELLKIRAIEQEDDFELLPITDDSEFNAARAEFLKSQSDAERVADDDEDAVWVEIEGVTYLICDVFEARNRKYAALQRMSETEDDSEPEILLYRYNEFESDDPELVNIDLQPIASDMEYEDVSQVFLDRQKAEEDIENA